MNAPRQQSPASSGLYLAVRRVARALQAGDEHEAVEILRAALERYDDQPRPEPPGENPPAFEACGFR